MCTNIPRYTASSLLKELYCADLSESELYTCMCMNIKSSFDSPPHPEIIFAFLMLFL